MAEKLMSSTKTPSDLTIVDWATACFRSAKMTGIKYNLSSEVAWALPAAMPLAARTVQPATS
jgi:hypothetical protein